MNTPLAGVERQGFQLTTIASTRKAARMKFMLLAQGIAWGMLWAFAWLFEEQSCASLQIAGMSVSTVYWLMGYAVLGAMTVLWPLVASSLRWWLLLIVPIHIGGTVGVWLLAAEVTRFNWLCFRF